VVLFDTLLDRYSRDEVRVVVAHELGHVRNRDVIRGVVYAALVAPAAGLAVQRLSWELSPERGTPGALPALGLAAAVVGASTGLIGNRLSRAIERRSDAYSLTLTGAPDAFISFERAIAVQNVADLEPPRWLTSLLSTHPPTAERIGAAVTYSGTAASYSEDSSSS
jgi:STE24 endopeptidase